MICVSIKNKNLEQILEILSNPEVELAEIRLDSCTLSEDDMRELFGNCDTPLVATWRLEKMLKGPEWKTYSDTLKAAVTFGARYLDLEVNAPSSISIAMQKLCRRFGTELIRSFHDYEGTPETEILREKMQKCVRYGADIVKIVTTAHTPEDALRVQALYDEPLQAPLIAFAMGDEGRSSRLECLKKGAPFTYACLSEDEATAPGQMSLAQMRQAVYANLPRLELRDLQMPSSKSFAQRAILAAALAEGTSHLSGYTPCNDSEAAIRAAEALGAKVKKSKDTLKIEGIGGIPRAVKMDAGESGLLARLLIPLLSIANEDEFTIEGRGTLLNRPLEGAADIMAAFGVLLSSEDRKGVHIPVKARGRLYPGTADIPGNGGSQLISGLLMALPLADKGSNIFVGEPKSIPYMFITLDILKKFGIRIDCSLEGDQTMIELQDWSYCNGINFTIAGGQRYKAADLSLEADWSSAANFLVAGAIFGSASLPGLDSKSVQADLSIIDALVEAGAAVSQEDGSSEIAASEDAPAAAPDGPLGASSGTICVRKAPLEAFDFDLNHAPDLFPIISILAAFCDGQSRIDGIRRLAGKECDRASAILEMLAQMGVEASVDGDTLVVEGENLASRRLSGRLLRGGNYSSHHDHRMVMALTVAGFGADSPIVVDDRECVAKSFPGFFAALGI